MAYIVQYFGNLIDVLIYTLYCSSASLWIKWRVWPPEGWNGRTSPWSCWKIVSFGPELSFLLPEPSSSSLPPHVKYKIRMDIDDVTPQTDQTKTSMLKWSSNTNLRFTRINDTCNASMVQLLKKLISCFINVTDLGIQARLAEPFMTSAMFGVGFYLRTGFSWEEALTRLLTGKEPKMGVYVQQTDLPLLCWDSVSCTPSVSHHMMLFHNEQ